MKKLVLGILLAFTATGAIADSNVKFFGSERIKNHHDQTCRYRKKLGKDFNLFSINKYGVVKDIWKHANGFENKDPLNIGLSFPFIKYENADFYWLNEDATCGLKHGNTELHGEMIWGQDSK